MANINWQIVDNLIGTKARISVATKGLQAINPSTLEGLESFKELINGNGVCLHKDGDDEIHIWARVVHTHSKTDLGMVWCLQLVVGEGSAMWAPETKEVARLELSEANAQEAKALLERGI